MNRPTNLNVNTSSFFASPETVGTLSNTPYPFNYYHIRVCKHNRYFNC